MVKFNKIITHLMKLICRNRIRKFIYWQPNEDVENTCILRLFNITQKYLQKSNKLYLKSCDHQGWIFSDFSFLSIFPKTNTLRDFHAKNPNISRKGETRLGEDKEIGYWIRRRPSCLILKKILSSIKVWIILINLERISSK